MSKYTYFFKMDSLLVILLVMCKLTFCSAVVDHETRLLNNLLENYNLRARPMTEKGVVQVNISMHIERIQEVNTKFQFISVLGWLNVKWNDPRLAWNRSEYGGLDYITIPSPDLWIPTFVLTNSASEYLYNEFWYTLFKVQVFSNGNLKWAPAGTFKADCLMDIDYFPFDEQICHFRFENWMYTGEKVNLTHTEDAEKTFLMFHFHDNGRWIILDKAVLRRDKYFFDSQPFPRVYFGIHIKRKSLFYVTNIILISVFLAILVLFMFMLPAESGERITMGITLLLAYSVFVLMINDSIPETSSAVPVIIEYLISFMFLTTMGICESVFILYCYFHNGDTGVPSSVRKIFINIIGVCLCQGKPKKLDYTRCNSNGSVELIERNIRKESYDSDDCRKEMIQLEWQHLSRVIDGLCFWLFLVVFVALLVTMLVIMPLTFSRKTMEEYMQKWLDE